jgi:hypothetical protein
MGVEEIFGSYKWNTNLAPRSKGDSHMHNHVNFSHLHVNHTIARLGVKLNNLGWIEFKEMLRSLNLHMEFGI